MRFTDPSRRRIGLAYLVGILAGVFGAIVKFHSLQGILLYFSRLMQGRG